ncbi:MAG: hypothetical protein QOJ62_583 [Actinomycetota bacterium]|jgi:hypothetical protein|nr:hypothetical protein [Actinomycetota bacterium]
MLASSTEFDGRFGRAMASVEYAINALNEAERFGASSDEIAGLCDEVIHRRLQLYVERIEAGWRAPLSLHVQMARDRALLGEPMSVYDDDPRR